MSDIRHLLEAAQELKNEELIEWLMKAEQIRRQEACCNCKTCKEKEC